MLSVVLILFFPLVIFCQGIINAVLVIEFQSDRVFEFVVLCAVNRRMTFVRPGAHLVFVHANVVRGQPKSSYTPFGERF